MIQEQSPHPGGSLAERVLGVDNPEDRLSALSRAHFTLTGEHVPPEELIAEAERLLGIISKVSDLEAYTVAPEVNERAVALNALVNMLVERKAARFNTLLRAWPAYEDLYSQHETLPSDDESSKALLVGSLSAVTSAAFAAFSEDVVGAQPVIVDPRASAAKRRHGTFVQANGLALPSEWTENMHVVETNILMSMLVDTEGKRVVGQQPEQVAMRALLRQAFRALRPRGSLLMYELPPRFDHDDRPCETAYNQDLVVTFADTLNNELGEAGFEDVDIGEGWELSGIDFLFDPRRAFNAYDRIPLPRFCTIYARKTA